MSRYAETFTEPKGPGDARPTAMKVLDDLELRGKLTDKIFLVTGVSSGIGIETLRTLYAAGAHVFGTARSLSKAQKVVEEIEGSTKGGKITLIEMDNESLASVKKGAEEFLKLSNNKLNVLITNAGVMRTPEGKTKDGFETQFGTNHLAHFYLFQLVKDALLASATPQFPSRVVTVSSIGMRYSRIRFDDYHFQKPGSYEPGQAYGQSKTANIYMANEIDRRYGARNLHATSLHPGGIQTGLMVHMDKNIIDKLFQDDKTIAYLKSPEQGAATTIYAALSPEWANKGGKFLSNCVEQGIVSEGLPVHDFSTDNIYAYGYDEASEKKLWQDSLKMVGLNDDQ